MPDLRFTLEHLNTPTGEILIVTDDDRNLRAVEWADLDNRMSKLLRRHYGNSTIRLCDAPSATPARLALEAYFDGEIGALAPLPVRTNGTVLQRAVWDALRQIPAGQTTSYGKLAARIARPTAQRAVGRANGANPIPIVVPCHRVIGADGALTGFAGGLDRKRWLLAHEGAIL